MSVLPGLVLEREARPLQWPTFSPWPCCCGDDHSRDRQAVLLPVPAAAPVLEQGLSPLGIQECLGSQVPLLPHDGMSLIPYRLGHC